MWRVKQIECFACQWDVIDFIFADVFCVLAPIASGSDWLGQLFKALARDIHSARGNQCGEEGSLVRQGSQTSASFVTMVGGTSSSGIEMKQIPNPKGDEAMRR